jgi:hypothetical protein
MASKVVVNAKAVADLQKRLAAHDRAIAREQQRRAEVVKHIEAMKILLGTKALRASKAEKPGDKPAVAEKVVARNSVTGGFVDRPALERSVPEAVVLALEKRGPLTAVQIRHAVAEAGVKREQLGATYSYLYTVLGRLVQRRRIVRVRDKYQLAESRTVVPGSGELKLVSGSPSIPSTH